jgi:type III restriction enzyme
MLIEAKKLQQNAVFQLIEVTRTKKNIVFRAPTGSGKTYMMADFMNCIIADNSDIVFIVSTRSKAGLAKQNYDKFCEYANKGFFPQLKPYLINSEIAGEERLFIPTEHNVYILPSDLNKAGGRLMQGALSGFLTTLTSSLYGKNKQLYLIKDECHIATKNLDLSADYFTKTFYFSATPKLSRGQCPDVLIKDEDAENAKLIKSIEWGDDNDIIDDAIARFKQVKNDYINQLGVNPCLIIQISNKDKAEAELADIRKVLDENQDLKWMLIVDDNKKCDTNDQIKTKLSVDKWKDFVKSNGASIDIIVFKMVISEGWDIPRACMLYQVRDTQSKQLDEQVMGRVRRNPRLLDFESLPADGQALAMTAWIWGVKPEEQKKVYGVKLQNEQEITANIKVKTTKLKPLVKKIDFDLASFISRKPSKTTHKSIFEIGRKLNQTETMVTNLIYGYATDFVKWWNVVNFLDDIEKESKKFYNDYAQSMEVAAEVSFAVSSHYTDNNNYVNIDNWLWKRRDGQNKFSFDSEAEREWTNILKDLSGDTKKIIDKQGYLFKNGDENAICLWGKNYFPNSAIKFEYYMGETLNSFPDFIMKDKFDRVHIFEVKSVNKAASQFIDDNLYNAKIAELKKCYKQASILTNQIFYLSVLDKDIWQITRYMNGNEETLSKDTFKTFLTTHNA